MIFMNDIVYVLENMRDQPSKTCESHLVLYWALSGDITKLPYVNCAIKTDCKNAFKKDCFLSGKKEINLEGGF